MKSWWLVAFWLLAVTVCGGILVGVPSEIEVDTDKLIAEPQHAYLAKLPTPIWPLVYRSDGPGAEQVSDLELFEDGTALGPAHTGHSSIRGVGGGRYSHWRGVLYFSSSDHSDPRTNGRRIHARTRLRLAPSLGWGVLGGLLVAAVAVTALGLMRRRIRPRDLLQPACWIGAMTMCVVSFLSSDGVWLWMALGLAATCLLWAVGTTRLLLARALDRQPATSRARRVNSTLAILTVALMLSAIEGALTAWEARGGKLDLQRLQPASTAPATASQATQKALDGARADAEALRAEMNEQQLRRQQAEATAPIGPEAAMATTSDDSLAGALRSFGVEVPEELIEAALLRASLITLPPELERREVEVEGAAYATEWHGVVHVKDRRGMRLTAPLPAPRDGVFRVAIVGDSLTYGDGVDEHWTYSRQLERRLATRCQVEVLNLGIDGDQSEDILRTIREFLPTVQPDLLIYGVSLNDFLPSGASQVQSDYRFPLPQALKKFLVTRSRLARLVRDAYSQTLLISGLHTSYHDQILAGFSNYQERFASDVAQMNALAVEADLPPAVGIVLSQNPAVGSRGHLLAQITEDLLIDAGFSVIDTEPYYRHFNQRGFRVSRWEGHPNELAHAIWAKMIDDHLRDQGLLAACRDIREFRSAARSP